MYIYVYIVLVLKVRTILCPNWQPASSSKRDMFNVCNYDKSMGYSVSQMDTQKLEKASINSLGAERSVGFVN